MWNVRFFGALLERRTHGNNLTKTNSKNSIIFYIKPCKMFRLPVQCIMYD